jgi:hypothetical protein
MVVSFSGTTNPFSNVTQPQIFFKCANGMYGVVSYLHKSKIVNCGVDDTT